MHILDEYGVKLIYGLEKYMIEYGVKLIYEILDVLVFFFLVPWRNFIILCKNSYNLWILHKFPWILIFFQHFHKIESRNVNLLKVTFS